MEGANHNVIIFGAGASFDAGIPLLGSFVDTMWNYAVRGKVSDRILAEDDRTILNEANAIRIELEKYNSRASFDIRNLEDILSLLTFEAIGYRGKTNNYDTLVKAVARTIELSCKFVYHSAQLSIKPATNLYHLFWHMLLGKGSKHLGNAPALLTFNYDLVLERALFEYLHSVNDHGWQPAVASCRLNYFLMDKGMDLSTRECEFERPKGRSLIEMVSGRRPVFAQLTDPEAEFPYLKLHGSLNWPSNMRPGREATWPTQTVESPLILPPVFNKMQTGSLDTVWGKALQVLREAKHIIIVGYSLPKTDIYMQYFLKSAVGPNSNLQKLIIFDPLLFKDTPAAKEMRLRYLECFAPQFANRIIFEPHSNYNHATNIHLRGTFEHFVHALGDSQNPLFFMP